MSHLKIIIVVLLIRKFEAEGKNGPLAPLARPLLHFTVNNSTAIRKKMTFGFYLNHDNTFACLQIVRLIKLQFKPLEEAMVILALAR